MCARTCLAAMLLAGSMHSASAVGAPVLEQPLSPERASGAAWADELERRVVSLSSALVGSEPSAAQQTSPRYASFEVADLDGALFGCGWLLEAPSPEERALLDLAGQILAGRSRSILSRRLVERGLASEVDVRLSDHGERTLFAVFILGTPLGLRTSYGDVLDAAIDELSMSGPTELELEQAAQEEKRGALDGGNREAVRRVVARYLQPRRRSVVELLPRNAPDPGWSVKPQKEAAASANGPRSASPDRKATAKPASRRADPTDRRIVKRGDTLTAIARRYDLTVSELARRNGIDPTRPIRVGQELVVPRTAKPAPARHRSKPR